MKSRVEKYSKLHQEIASDAESNIENSDLSHFANRLNEIDDQFERVHTASHNVVAPSRARKNEYVEAKEKEALVNTFENHYLKDFLEEVKEYNVKKGYRDMSDTQANILQDLHDQLDSPKFYNQVEEELEFAEEEKVEEQSLNQEVYDEKKLEELANELIEDKPFEDSEKEDQSLSDEKEEFSGETLVFGHEIFDEKSDEQNLDEETIAMAIQEMSFDESEDFTDELSTDNNFEQNLLEQTQTLQHKVIDLEKDLDEMSSTTARTNQLLHVVLSLLLFAIIVVALLLVAQLPQFRR